TRRSVRAKIQARWGHGPTQRFGQSPHSAHARNRDLPDVGRVRLVYAPPAEKRPDSGSPDLDWPLGILTGDAADDADASGDLAWLGRKRGVLREGGHRVSSREDKRRHVQTGQ